MVVAGWKGFSHHQSARSPVGPGHGATAGGGTVDARASDPALKDGELSAGPGSDQADGVPGGDTGAPAACQLGTVLPMSDVVGVQAGWPTTGTTHVRSRCSSTHDATDVNRSESEAL